VVQAAAVEDDPHYRRLTFRVQRSTPRALAVRSAR
jgi:hypothetical protein